MVDFFHWNPDNDKPKQIHLIPIYLPLSNHLVTQLKQHANRKKYLMKWRRSVNMSVEYTDKVDKTLIV